MTENEKLSDKNIVSITRIGLLILDKVVDDVEIYCRSRFAASDLRTLAGKIRDCSVEYFPPCKEEKRDGHCELHVQLRGAAESIAFAHAVAWALARKNIVLYDKTVPITHTGAVN